MSQIIYVDRQHPAWATALAEGFSRHRHHAQQYVALDLALDFADEAMRRVHGRNHADALAARAAEKLLDYTKTPMAGSVSENAAPAPTTTQVQS